MLNLFKKQRNMVRDYRKVFSTPEGQRVLLDITKVCGFNELSFGKDSHTTAFNEGKRSVALRILKTVRITDEELEKLMHELEDRLEEQEELYE